MRGSGRNEGKRKGVEEPQQRNGPGRNGARERKGDLKGEERKEEMPENRDQ